MKLSISSGDLAKRFQRVAKQSKPEKPKPKRKPPLSIRLSDEERAMLREQAGTKPISTYVKSCLFADKPARKTRYSDPVRDYEMLARLLSALGQSNVFHNLDRLVHLAEEQKLDLSNEQVQTIVAACVCVTEIRNDLVSALGLKAE